MVLSHFSARSIISKIGSFSGTRSKSVLHFFFLPNRWRSDCPNRSEGCFLSVSVGQVRVPKPRIHRCCSSLFLTARSGRSLAWSADRRSVFHVSRIPATSSIHTKAFPDRFPDRSFWSQACSRFGGRRCFQIMLVSFFKGFRRLLFGFERFIFCSVLSVHLRLHSPQLSYTPVVIPFHTT